MPMSRRTVNSSAHSTPSAIRLEPKVCASCCSALRVCNLWLTWCTDCTKYLSTFTYSGRSSDHRRKLDRPSPKSSRAKVPPPLRNSCRASWMGCNWVTCSCSVSSITKEDTDNPAARAKPSKRTNPSRPMDCTNAEALMFKNNLPSRGAWLQVLVRKHPAVRQLHNWLEMGRQSVVGQKVGQPF